MGQKTELISAEAYGSRKHRSREVFIVNVALLVSGIAVSVSGLLLQFHYHLRKNPDDSLVLSLGRAEWNTFHVWASAVFLAAAVYHVRAHRKWYAGVCRKRLFSKNSSTLVLTLLTLIVVVTGLIPLLIRCFGGASVLCLSIIELHDKAALLFLIVAFCHTTKRIKRYFRAIS